MEISSLARDTRELIQGNGTVYIGQGAGGRLTISWRTPLWEPSPEVRPSLRQTNKTGTLQIKIQNLNKNQLALSQKCRFTKMFFLWYIEINIQQVLVQATFYTSTI